MSDRIVLIIGAGSNIGKSVANSFKAQGYKVALASRTQDPEASTSTELHIPTDCAHPDEVASAFEKVRTAWGIPLVVVYNAYVHTENNPKDTFEVPLDDFKQHNYVNMISAYAAAQKAVEGWKTLATSTVQPTFIYTGNCCNVTPLGGLVDLTVGKAGSASLIEMAAEAYKGDGFRFYYTDQRLEDGTPMWDGPDGEEHATHYLELAEAEEKRPWQQTFVAGQGYKKF